MLDAGWFNFYLTALTIMTTFMGSMVWFTWWLQKQFAANRHLTYETGEKIVNTLGTKLDAHEKLDDERFSKITDSIWDIKLRNATVDKIILHAGNGITKEKIIRAGLSD